MTNKFNVLLLLLLFSHFVYCFSPLLCILLTGLPAKEILSSFCFFLMQINYCSSFLFSLLGADGARQLSTADIWKTGKWTTASFHRIQQSTILVSMATRNIFWITIDTDEITWMFVTIIWSHQIPLILLGPSRWTVIPCGHHQHWTTWRHEADNTGCVMIMKISLKRVSVVLTDFILSAVNVSCILVTIFVLVVLWIVRKTKVVGSTTDVAVVFTSDYPWNVKGICKTNSGLAWRSKNSSHS